MRTRLTLGIAIGTALAIACTGIAAAYNTSALLVAPQVTINGSFKPTRLPKSRLVPIHLKLEAAVNTASGAAAPAMSQVLFEADRNIAIDDKGVAVCKIGRIEARETSAASRVCKRARVGSGHMESEIVFPDQPPVVTKSRMVAFNGGIRHGVRTILIHSTAKVPIPVVTVMTAKVMKIHRGAYSTELLIPIPKIAGGAGSVKKFSLSLFRAFAFKGKKHGYVSAECPTAGSRCGWKRDSPTAPTTPAAATTAPAPPGADGAGTSSSSPRLMGPLAAESSPPPPGAARRGAASAG